MSGPAGTRTTPYAEAICRTDPNVFMCEDFEDDATYPRVSPSYGSVAGSWNNPAFAGPWGSLYNAGRGTDAGSAEGRGTPNIPIPNSVTPTNNRVYRLTVIGSPGGDPNTAGAANTVEGCLANASSGLACTNLATAGKRYTNYYVRWQMYISPNATFPVQGSNTSDIKTLFTQPDGGLFGNTSADFQNGGNFTIDYNCVGQGNMGNVLIMRRADSGADPGTSYNFREAPLRNNMGIGPPPGPGAGTDYCPALAPGMPANNANAVRFQTNRWYTIEMHFILGNPQGTAEMWIDGNLAYRFAPGTGASGSGIPTCGTCNQGMGYFFITGYKRGPGGGYIEYDNLVMSTAPIGVPGGAVGTPPMAPTNMNLSRLAPAEMPWLYLLAMAVGVAVVSNRRRQ